MIDKEKYLHTVTIPAEAMKYNGEYLENLISGYSTVNVVGRETLEASHATSGSRSHVDGEVHYRSMAEAKEITITYLLVADSNEAFREAYNKLKYHLFKERSAVPISFQDEEDYTYYGMVNAIDEVEGGINTVVGEFTVIFHDPYKYRTPKSNEAVGKVSFELIESFPTHPIIEVTMASAANNINILHEETGRRIVLNGSYKSGDVIKVDAKGRTLTKNGGNIKNNLDFNVSDYGAFKLQTGFNTVSVTPNTAQVKVTYSEAKL